MISTYKKLGLLFVTALSVALMAGCNDNLRQFIVPVPKPTGDPGAFSHAVVLATNQVAGANGITMHIDVSGDSNAGQVNTGPNPVFLGKTGTSGAARVFVINGDNTITSYLALSPTTSAVNTVTQPGGVTGTVAGGTSSSGNFYAINNGSNDLSQVSGFALAVTQTIPVGTGPVAIAGNAANSKIYVVNNGSNDVTVVSTTDNSVLKTIPVGSHPIWGVMADNGVQVFIVNQGDGTPTNPGSVSVIDTNLDIVIPCSGTACNASTGTISLGFKPAIWSPNFAFYDGKRQRLYVSNTGDSSISVIKADGINLGVTPQIVPSLLANIHITAPPTSVVALSDGSKAYAALGGCPAGTNHTNLLTHLASCTGNQVSVIDANALVEITPPISVGAGAISIDAAGDASRVYVVSAQAGNVSIIRPSSNSVSTTIAPAADSSCTSNCTHIPFMVRVFP